MGFSRQEYWSEVPLPSLPTSTNAQSLPLYESFELQQYLGPSMHVILKAYKHIKRYQETRKKQEKRNSRACCFPSLVTLEIQSWPDLWFWHQVSIFLDNILKSRDITLPTKVHLVKAYGFSSSHVWMWELDCEESWVPKNWCLWTVVLEKTLESPLDCKEIQPVHPKGNQSWMFIGRMDSEAGTPVLWPPDAKSWLIWKDPDAGKDWSWEEKGTTEDEMIGWHHWPTCVRVDSQSWWWTGRPGMLQSMGWQNWTRLSDWTELNWTALSVCRSAHTGAPHLTVPTVC